ncbi:MAG TPA: sugar nucleotide-binding protein [Terriglobales bacterium]
MLVARDLKVLLTHVSTDVFDGSKASPCDETDAPQPLNVYGNSKLAGEYFVRFILDRFLVLRTSALYGKAPCRAKGGRNFIDLMVELAIERGEVRVVDSERVIPTSTRELAQRMVVLSGCDSYGLYDATAEGSCSWYELPRRFFSLWHQGKPEGRSRRRVSR